MEKVTLRLSTWLSTELSTDKSAIDGSIWLVLGLYGVLGGCFRLPLGCGSYKMESRLGA